jgi:hypothetical protein
MASPIISVYGSACRPQNWLSLYNTLRDSSINFEIVFVGPNEPNYPLPDNFKYIQSNVKPAQCVEIASRYTSGELIMQIADDLEFRTPKMLDSLYRAYVTYNDERLIVSCRFMVDGVDVSDLCCNYLAGHSETPMISVAGLMSNKLYKEVGGIDRNFMAVCGDMDMIMRVHKCGGSVVLSDVYVNESRVHCGGDLYALYSVQDRALLDSLWMVGERVQLDRARLFEPFSDERILEESQGPKGRWI